MKELLPGYKPAMHGAGGRPVLNALIGRQFRAGASLDLATHPDEVSRRLDDAVAAFALLNRRVCLLEAMAADTASDTVTSGIRVTAKSELVPAMSSASGDRYYFTYAISIKNEAAEEPVQVVSRYWEIRDEEGHTEEVRGSGVVGHQPVLEKGAEFSYRSQATLRRLRGSMRGSYVLVGQESGRMLEVGVGPFALSPGRAPVGRRGKGRRGGAGRGGGERGNLLEEEMYQAAITPLHRGE